MAFTFGYTPQTPEAINRKRQIAQALMMQGMDTSPIQSPWQGAARIAQALVGGYQGQQAEQAAMKLQQEQEAKAKAAQEAADYEKRNTPEFKEVDGSIYNWNPYMAEGGKPVLLSQAMQKADEWKKLNDGMMYRQGADGQLEYSQVPGGTGTSSANPYADEFAKQYAKDSAKKNAETARKITDSGLDAQNQLNSLDRMEQLTSDPDVYQGTGAQFTLPIRRAVSNIPGLNSLIPYSNPDEVAKADELNSLSNTMALMVRNPDAGLGMPGALSDKDREFLQSTVPGLSRSPGGNKLMIEAAKRVQRRKIEIAEFKAQYVQQNGAVDDRFFEIVSKWASENPLFEDLQGATGAPEALSADSGKMELPVQITSDDDYAQLPSGAVFIGPDGVKRRKP